MVQSVFGLTTQLPVEVSTWALVGTVAFTIMFEYAMHSLEHRVAGTPFLGMLNKVYKELMIMGLISFGVSIAIQANILNNSSISFYAFELAHIMIFFTAMFFVLQATMLMFLSTRLKVQYDKATKDSTEMIQAQVSLERKSFTYRNVWLPYNTLRKRMEFKIMSSFFVHQFDLPFNFDFGLYMRYSIDAYILSLLEIDPFTWMVVIALLLSNWGRVWLFVHLFGNTFPDDTTTVEEHHSSTSSSHHSSSHATTYPTTAYPTSAPHRLLSGSSDVASVLKDQGTTDGTQGMLAFVVGGWILVFFGVLWFIFARQSELRLLRQAGVHDLADYEKVLEKIGIEELEAGQLVNNSAPEDRLKSLKIKAAALQETATRHATPHSPGNDGPGSHNSSQHISMYGLASAVERLHITRNGMKGTSPMNSPPGSPNANSSQCSVSNATASTHSGVGGTGEKSGVRLSFFGLKNSLRKNNQMNGDSPTVYTNKPKNSISNSVTTTNRKQLYTQNSKDESGVLMSPLSPKMRPSVAKILPLDRMESSPIRTLRLPTDETSGKRILPPISATAAPPGIADALQQFSIRRQGTFEEEDFENGSSAPQSPIPDNAMLLSDISRKVVEVDMYPPRQGTDESSGRRRSSERPKGRRSIARVVAPMVRRLSIAPMSLELGDENIQAKEAEGVTETDLKVANDISHIYPLSSPWLFHMGMGVMLLVNCFYFALWATNFVVIATKHPTQEAFYQIMMLLPPMFTMKLLEGLIKTSSLLLAVSALNPGIIARVVDEQLDTEVLISEFRDKMQQAFEIRGQRKTGLTDMYEELQSKGQIGMTLGQLRTVCAALQFPLTMERRAKLFKAMDINMDGNVTYQEMHMIVYPDDFRAEQGRALKIKSRNKNG